MAPAPAPAPTRTPAASPDPARRHRTRPARRTRQARRAGTPAPAVPVSVWSHRPDDPQSTLVALIGTYTRPRDLVVLLAPPGLAGPDSGAGWRTQLSSPGPAVTRLRRRIQTRTAAAPHPPSPDPACYGRGSLPAPGPGAGTRPAQTPAATTRGPGTDGGAGARIGRGPDTGRCGTGQDIGQDTAAPHRVRPDQTGSERAHLVVTAVDPHALDWIAHLPWTGLLTCPGLLAVVTLGDRREVRWVDPLPVLTGSLTGAGLAWHDRIVLHHDPAEPAPGPPDPGTAARHLRVHTELLLFAVAQPTPALQSRREAGDRDA